MDCKMEDGFCDRELCATTTESASIVETIEGISKRIITYGKKNIYIFAIKYIRGFLQKLVLLALHPRTVRMLRIQYVPHWPMNAFVKEDTSSLTILALEVISSSFEQTNSNFWINFTEIGTNIGCTEDSNCSTTSRYCGPDGACICTNSQYYSDDLTRCLRGKDEIFNCVWELIIFFLIPVAFQPNFRCTEDLACEIFGKDAVCVADGFYLVCKCRLGYQLNEETFLCEESQGNVGEDACVQDSDCSNVNAVCTDSICSCPTDFRLVENTCVPSMEILLLFLL